MKLTLIWQPCAQARVIHFPLCIKCEISLCETAFTFIPLDYSENPESLFLSVWPRGQNKTVKSKVNYYRAMILWSDVKSEEVKT